MSYSLEEIKGLEKEKALIIQKIAALREALVPAMDAGVKFAYEHEIRQWEQRKDEITRILGKAFNLNTESGKARLREKVNELQISKHMGRWQLVNCNRKEPRDGIEAYFDHNEVQRKNNPLYLNQFYFLTACSKQMPHSLGECMIHQLLSDPMDESGESDFNPPYEKNSDRIRLEKLPISSTLEKSQTAFKKLCSKWFDWENPEAFVEAIANNRFKLTNPEYSILNVEFHKDEWKPFFPEYFNWIAEQLSKRPPGGPALMVFIVLYMDELHCGYERKTEKQTDPVSGEIRELVTEHFSDETVKTIIGEINTICEKHPNAGHFYPLYPVVESDLIKWFHDLGERNQARLQPVLDTIVEGLSEEELEQYRQPKPALPDQPAPNKPEPQKLLNMYRVELVQELVYELYNK